jgi:hypothetical protein
MSVPDDGGRFLMIGPDSVVKRAYDVRTRRIGNKQLIARGEDLKELNDVAAVIWRLSDGVRSVRVISEGISAEYDVSPEEALNDVIEFFTEMTGAQFME